MMNYDKERSFDLMTQERKDTIMRARQANIWMGRDNKIERYNKTEMASDVIPNKSLKGFSMVQEMVDPRRELRKHNFSFGYNQEDNRGGGGINKKQRNASNAIELNHATKVTKDQVKYWKDYQVKRNRSSNVQIAQVTPLKASNAYVTSDSQIKSIDKS